MKPSTLIFCLFAMFIITHANPASRRGGCERGEYHCRRGNQCLPEEWVCDGDEDCLDGDDEPDTCPTLACDHGFFHCDSGRCIPESWVCDKGDDCSDRTDETGCTYFPEGHTPNRRHPHHQFSSDSRKKRK